MKALLIMHSAQYGVRSENFVELSTFDEAGVKKALDQTSGVYADEPVHFVVTGSIGVFIARDQEYGDVLYGTVHTRFDEQQVRARWEEECRREVDGFIP